MKKTLATLLAVVMLLSTFCVVPVASAEEPEAIIISSAEDFLKIGNDNAFPLNGNYKLGNNFTVTSDNYDPIGSYAAPFTGTFDGDGKTVTVDLTYINTTATASVEGCAYAGLFGCVKNATVTNLTVVGTMKVNTVCGYVGGIIGCAFGNTTVSNCTSAVDMDVNLSGGNNDVSYIGGVVGMFNQSGEEASDTPTISDSNNNGAIDIEYTTEGVTAKATGQTDLYHLNGAGGIGGIVGGTGQNTNYAVQITIQRCINYGDISVETGNQNFGGILGTTTYNKVGSSNDTYGKAEIFWCANYGDLTRTNTQGNRVSAIAALMYIGQVKYCFNVGNLTSLNATGVAQNTSMVGGMADTRTSKTAGSGKANGYNAIDHTFSATPFGGTQSGFMDSSWKFVADESEWTNANNITSHHNYVLYGVPRVKNNLRYGGDYIPNTDTNTSGDRTSFIKALETHAKALANDANLDAEAKKFWGSLKFAGLGDLVTVYFDFNAPTGAKVLGYQVTDVDEENQTYNIRFISILDKLDYASAGYDVVATYGTDGRKEFDEECKTVYTSLTASNVEGAPVKYTRVGDDYYIMAYAITGIPASVGAITFEITPYVYEGETKVPGETVTLVYTPEVSEQ